jgi:hypothetical protein
VDVQVRSAVYPTTKKNSNGSGSVLVRSALPLHHCLPLSVVRLLLFPFLSHVILLTRFYSLPLLDSSIPLFWPLVIPYLIFMYLDKAPSHGGRVSMSNRRSIYFKHFAGKSFSRSMEVSLDLTKDVYVIGYYPVR